MIKRYSSAISLILLLTSRGLAADCTPEKLAAWMCGAFSSTEQAHRDHDFRDLTLHAAFIWSDRRDGPWIYVEQALADASDHPYRQYIYQLSSQDEHTLRAQVFELPEPIAATGAWKNPELLNKIDPSVLLPQPGCMLLFQLQADGSFIGRTEDKGCPSTLRGASYAISELSVSEKQMIVWDRGYNASGVQVWGSVNGGYIFKKSE